MKLLSLGFAFLLSFSLFAQKELGDGLFAKINTNRGDIIIKLEFEKVPMTVASFVGLAEGKLKYDTVKITKPFFDSLKFHRVIANFMVQGGDPKGNGSGNPGYKFPDEFDSTLTHDRAGTLSMANSGPGTNGSQFFITHKDTPWLNDVHSVFGYVVQGQDVVKAILKDDIIIKVDIIRNGKKAKKFKAHKIFPKMVEAEKAKAKEVLAVRNKTFYDEMKGDYPKALQTESGLMYEIMAESKGSLPIVGAEIAIHYTGFFLDGKKFDSSFDRDSKLVFVIGARRVIKGMDEGVQLCNVGGKIKLIIPEWLAYGKSGRATIPPNSHLIFDIEIFSSTQDQ